MHWRLSTSRILALALLAAASLHFTTQGSLAQPQIIDESTVDSQEPAPVARPGKLSARQRVEHARATSQQYFVEFRSRHALSYGHTFLVHGKLRPNGQIGQVSGSQVAGLHPAGEGPQLWTVGHVLPVPAETGPSDGDTEDEYISNRFRVVLNAEQYAAVSAHIRAKQAKPTMWHAVLYNCNAWVGEIAQFMGLDAPGNALLYPTDFIDEMKRLNAGRVPVLQRASAG